MSAIRLLPLVVAGIWTCSVVLALQSGELSASAGRLPGPWVATGIAASLLYVALVVVAVCYLPAWIPRIVVRLIQLVGMAGAFWSAGTLTRAVYALSI